MKHYISVTDFHKEELEALLEEAKKIKYHPEAYSEAMKGRILASLFFEPSTRTRLSFESAMLRLGGSVLGFSEAGTSSVAKGESLKDTLRTVSGYSDIITMRHPVEGAAMHGSFYVDVPIINAGDGKHQHPTQTLTDLLTISNELGRLDHLDVVLCGDLANGRTVHSLVEALSLFEGNRFYFIAPSELQIPDYITAHLEEGTYTMDYDLPAYLPEADVLYMTRVQKERFRDYFEYERLKDVFVLDEEKMALAKEDMIVLHPLPRVKEIMEEVDSDPRALYFKQAKYGVYARMALILKLMRERDDHRRILPEGEAQVDRCPNGNCITKKERIHGSIAKRDNGTEVCIYCDSILND